MSSNPFASPEDLLSPSDIRPPATLPEILFSMQGRIPRSTYWLASLGLGFAYALLMLPMVFLLRESPELMLVLILLSYIPMVWMSFCIQGKRWHDRGKSAWWILINFVPYIGAFWSFIELGCLAGTPGDNEYGQDPLLRYE